MHGESSERWVGLDALRGADMLLIAGLDVLCWHLARLFPENGVLQGLGRQMGHVTWEGFSVYDGVFPLFVFLSGVSLCLSLRRSRASWGRWRRLLRRALLLVMLGWAVNGAVTLHPASMRFASVLGLIGLAGWAAGSVVMALRGRALPVAAVALLLLAGVGAAQAWGGDLTPAGCVNARVDALLCPGRLHLGCLDPEGPLCIVSATGLCLLGWLAGHGLAGTPRPTARRCLLLAAVGAAAAAAGLCLPCIKNIWTPGFVLLTAGAGALLLAGAALLCEVAGLRAWALPLRAVGCNALLLYLLTHVLDVYGLAERLSCGLWGLLLPSAALPAAYAATVTAGVVALALWLYRRGIVIRL